ncbi:LysR family transcriptional regulator [Amycolatopsis sp. NPDC004368]
MPLENVDLNLLKALDVLLEERQVSRAAERFHLSQSAMSRALARLRETFADELLVRTSDGYVLTPRARAIKDELSEIMPRLRTLVGGTTFDPATATGTMHLASTDYGLEMLADVLYSAFFSAAPQMSLVVEPVVPTTFDDVDRGRVDLILSPITPPPPLRREVLFTDDFVCVMAADHPLAGRALTLPELAGHPHVRVAAMHSQQMLVTSRLTAVGISSTPELLVPYFSAALAALPGTPLIALLPRRFAARHRGERLHVAELPPEFGSFDYPMLWHPRLTGDPAHRWLRSLLVQAGSALGS